jgi:hypothetical protein
MKALAAFCLMLLIISSVVGQNRQSPSLNLDPEAASRFARLALKCVAKEFPNKPEHVMNNERDVQTPKSLHPAFYGCYDWHSSVHGHWLLVRLLRTFPNLPEAPKIREALNANLSADNIRGEVDYLKQPSRQSFERTYGWAWLLKLAAELHEWNDPDGSRWSKNLQPLANALIDRYLDFLPKQNYPIRTGVHPNTAFGLAFAHDYALTAKNEKLKVLIEAVSKQYYEKDSKYPADWEPGGEDFFSAALMEADLMRRVLPSRAYRLWLRRFLPMLWQSKPMSLLEPAVVTDRSDPKLVHLDGLNLSRAWTMRSIAGALPMNDAARRRLAAAADRHAHAGLAHVASGDYAGEHWLASFAVYLLSTPAPE